MSDLIEISIEDDDLIVAKNALNKVISDKEKYINEYDIEEFEDNLKKSPD